MVHLLSGGGQMGHREATRIEHQGQRGIASHANGHALLFELDVEVALECRKDGFERSLDIILVQQSPVDGRGIGEQHMVFIGTNHKRFWVEALFGVKHEAGVEAGEPVDQLRTFGHRGGRTGNSHHGEGSGAGCHHLCLKQE